MLTPQEQAELAQLEKQMAGRQPQQVSGLTPEEEAELAALEQQIPPQQKQSLLSSIGSSALSGLATAGEFVDRYTGAPTRAALMQVAQGNPGQALGAFGSQFGESTQGAPTGYQIAEQLGVPEYSLIDDPNAAIDAKLRAQGFQVEQSKPFISLRDAVGTGIDVGADVSNIVPVGAIAKTAGKAGVQAAAKGAIGAGKLAGKAVVGAGDIALTGAAKGLDVALDSTKASDALAVGKKAAENAIETIKDVYRPSVAGDYEKFIDIAQRNGINPSILPESVEFGPKSTITKKSLQIAEGPGGDDLANKYLEAKAQVQGAIDNKLSEIAKGPIPDDLQAGQGLLDAYDDAVKNIVDEDMVTHSSIINQNKSMNLSQDATKVIKEKLNTIRKKAIDKAKYGYGNQKSESIQVLKDIDTLQNSFDKFGNMSYKRAYEALSNIGEEAFKKVPPGADRVPVDRKMLQDLYFTMKDSMIESVGQIMGPETANQLAMTNVRIKDALNQKGILKKTFSGDKSPEIMAQSLARSADVKRIKAMKEFLSPEAFDQFRGYYINKLVSKSADEGINYATTVKNFKKNKNVLAEIYSPEELQGVSELIALDNRVLNPVLNTSNTNTARRFENIKDSVINAVTGSVELDTLKKMARERLASGKSLDNKTISSLNNFSKYQDDFIKSVEDKGFKFEFYPDELGTGDFGVSVFDKNGKEVGSVGLRDYGDKIGTQTYGQVKVSKEARRNGLASAMYALAEKKTGKKMAPSSTQTEFAKNMWSNKKRPFGEPDEEVLKSFNKEIPKKEIVKSFKYESPLLKNKRTQVLEVGKNISIQERNKEAEKRKRALYGNN